MRSSSHVRGMSFMSVLCIATTLCFLVGDLKYYYAVHGHQEAELQHTHSSSRSSRGSGSGHKHYHHRHAEEADDDTSLLRTCGQDDPTIAQQAATQTAVEAFRAVVGGARHPNTTINVHWFDIRPESDPYSSYDAQDSLDVLNAAYGPAGFQFQLETYEEHFSDDWYYGGFRSSEEIDMKLTLRQGNASDLNIYMTAGANKTLLGWATFPDRYTAVPWYDGVVCRDETAPGGNVTNYDEGDTMVHEVGHWFGLYHVFQGLNCSSPTGDFVDDTPASSEPDYYCEQGKDSCPDDAGEDPINNFMNYGYDSCLLEFTAGQNERIQALWYQYRTSATQIPTMAPTVSQSPSQIPTQSQSPSTTPSNSPTQTPSAIPSVTPTTSSIPTETPTRTRQPTDVPSPAPVRSPPSSPSFPCFASSVMTHVDGKGLIAIPDVQVGDQVLTASGTYQMVYALDHFHRTKPTEFLQIFNTLSTTTTTTIPIPLLELTSLHMIFIEGKEDPIPAHQLQVGDCLLIWKNGTFQSSEPITKISTVIRNGFFNVLTVDGSIVVNNVVASTYPALLELPTTTNNNNMMMMMSYHHFMSQQKLVHFALSPIRSICSSSHWFWGARLRNHDDNHIGGGSAAASYVHEFCGAAGSRSDQSYFAWYSRLHNRMSQFVKSQEGSFLRASFLVMIMMLTAMTLNVLGTILSNQLAVLFCTVALYMIRAILVEKGRKQRKNTESLCG